MLYVTLALAVIVLLLVLMLERATKRHQLTTDALIADAAVERRSLLDRIQHPHIPQVQPVEGYERPEPPRDAQQLAHIGQIVPDGVDFGGVE